jgi:putative ABC transport system permease protein
MGTLLQDFRYGLRIMARAPGFTAVAVLTLALGIGASTVGFSVFYNLLFNAFAAKNANRLAIPVVLDAESPGDREALTCSLSDLDLIRQQNHVFENIVGSSGGIALVGDGLKTYQFNDSRVTSDAFEFYGVPALLGRGIEPEDGKAGALPIFVMSYKTWKDDFNGDLNALGKNYVVDGEPRSLVGVMPPRFHAYGPGMQIWTPITWNSGTSGSGQKLRLNLLGRLRRGTTLEAASSNFEVIAKRLAAIHPNDFPKHFTTRVESAEDFLMGPKGGGPTFHSDVKHLMYDLLVAVMILLLIACSNVANLLLARGAVREKEIAVRSALGATRGRLVRQLLAESSLLAMSACVLGCVFAWIGLKFVATVLPQSGGTGSVFAIMGGEVVVGLGVPVLAFAIVVTLLTTLICGLAPALRVVRADVQPHLSGSKGASGSFGHGKFRAGLIIGEVALSIVLLVGAGLMIRTLFLLTHVDLGFNPKNVLMVAFIPPPTHAKLPPGKWFTSPEGEVVLQKVVDRLKTLPGVADVSIQDTIPGYGPGRGPQVTAPGSGRVEEAGLLSCDENFMRTVELRLIQGSWLSRHEVDTAHHVVVINQRLAHDLFGKDNPVGQQLEVKRFQGVSISSEDTYFQIVGVVADIKTVGPQQPAIPIVFIPFTVRGGNFLLLKTEVAPDSLKRAVQEQVWEVDPNEIFVVLDPLTTFLQRLTYAPSEFGVAMFGPLASIALLLVIAGVFSVMAYTVSLQTHEIGIRMALGAQQGNIMRMVLLRGLRLVAAGIVVGVAASLELTRFIASQIWGISATDVATFVSVAILLTIVALAACWLPARRAMKIEPMEALRYE